MVSGWISTTRAPCLRWMVRSVLSPWTIECESTASTHRTRPRMPATISRMCVRSSASSPSKISTTGSGWKARWSRGVMWVWRSSCNRFHVGDSLSSRPRSCEERNMRRSRVLCRGSLKKKITLGAVERKWTSGSVMPASSRACICTIASSTSLLSFCEGSLSPIISLMDAMILGFSSDLTTSIVPGSTIPARFPARVPKLVPVASCRSGDGVLSLLSPKALVAITPNTLPRRRAKPFPAEDSGRSSFSSSSSSMAAAATPASNGQNTHVVDAVMDYLDSLSSGCATQAKAARHLSELEAVVEGLDLEG
mmetsp:Transcript_60944/g.139416  ORF Transcript_60944/g.139416 Transcript_60944/m.139416 type:complete len:308 (+) Transcript_60944:640-1563(+)